MEERIIRLMRERDEEGVELLQKKYGPMVAYIVSGILPDRRDVDECIGDVYLQAWNKFQMYDEAKGKLSTWLTAIARNTALNCLKRRRDSAVEFNDDIGASPSPEKAVLTRENTRRLKDAIYSLSSDERRLFYRKYYYIQSTAQIAAELGMTERAVEGRLYRMRKKLQKLLGGDLA